jgi:hypothetical protein
MSEQPVNGFVRCNGCGFDYHVSVKHDCPVPAAPTETREPDPLDEIYERSKRDDAFIAGSEVRVAIGRVRRAETREKRLEDAVIDVLSHFDSCDKCGLVDGFKNRLRAALERKG